MASQRNKPSRLLLIRVKRAVLVLLASESVTSLGVVPSGAVHCQLKLPSPLTEQERVRLGVMPPSSCTTGEGGRTENGGSAVGTVIPMSGGGEKVEVGVGGGAVAAVGADVTTGDAVVGGPMVRIKVAMGGTG